MLRIMNCVVILYFFITVNLYIKLEMAQVHPACTTIEVSVWILNSFHYTSRTCYMSSLVENNLLERRNSVLMLWWWKYQCVNIACFVCFTAWAEAGLFPVSDLQNLRKVDSDLEGHPTPRLNFVDVGTGSLGQGLPVACGMAYVGKYFDEAFYR